MVKYSYEFKTEVVQSYLNGAGIYIYSACEYNIPSKEIIEKWVKSYKEFGNNGSMSSR